MFVLGFIPKRYGFVAIFLHWVKGKTITETYFKAKKSFVHDRRKTLISSSQWTHNYYSTFCFKN
jgi:hypothetical protein